MREPASLTDRHLARSALSVRAYDMLKLLILDHGEGFLSVYANNETLLHGVGDQVAADEVIASVGNTGGHAQSGLYFEMRYQGRPFDPLAWAVAR